MADSPYSRRLTEQGVIDDLQRQPHLLMRLAENALTVAESLRDNYFKNTAKFVTALRRAIQEAAEGKREDPILTVQNVGDAQWADVQGEVVTFIDGGLGQVEISSQVPILLRVGSYCVRTGERHLSQREQFGYYPVILGDLQGGSKQRRDFPDIVRITAELLAGLSALERIPDLRVLMFHGPLVYLVPSYAGHTPFTERDIDRFLHQYAPRSELGRELKEQFLQEVRVDIYPRMTDNSEEWASRRLFEPLAWMAYLYRRLVRTAATRNPIPIIAGVVERGERQTEFAAKVLLDRVFRGLRATGKIDYFNEMYGRSDLRSPRGLLDQLGYTDTLLLAMLLQPGEYSEPWEMGKYDEFRYGDVTLPDDVRSDRVNFAALKPGPLGFPRVIASYLKVSETTDPIRVEVFCQPGSDQLAGAMQRVYLYARLLPGYGFPVGLDIVDKYAKVPAWMTQAYGKLIRYHLGISLQRGEISDLQMRRILLQAIYMTHRDWLFRPTS